MRNRTLILAALALAAVLATLAGCGSKPGSGGRPVVVATTTQLGDFTRVVGGGRVTVHQILQPNTDPHEYQPRPADVAATTGARALLVSGDGLDTWASRIAAQGGHPAIADVGNAVPVRLPGEAKGPGASRYDPHWWHDPVNAIAAVKRIRAELAQIDSGGAASFARSATAYLARLRKLDSAIRGCFSRIPAAQRKLVTSHDAFAYFAHRYGVTIVGAIIPSQTTQAQPSAGDVKKLAAQVKREHVRAIFLESSTNPNLAKAVAAQTGAVGNLTLYGDTLGPSDSPGATYLTMEAANANAMMRGFSGGRLGCPQAAPRP